MKRSIDEDMSGGGCDGFLLNPPIISELSGRPQILGGRRAHKLTNSDALTYLKDVKDMFLDNKEKYEEFLDVMKEFSAQRRHSEGYTFLPKGYEIILSQDEPQAKIPVEFEEAMQFVNKLRMRFQGDDHVYKSFLEIMNMYRKETKSVTKVYQEVADLLHNQPDLLNEFTNFLPDYSTAASSRYVYSSRSHETLLGDRSSHIASIMPLHSRNKDISCQADCDVSVVRDASADMEDSYQENDHKIHDGKEKVRREDREQKHSQDKDFDNNGMNSVNPKHKSANTLEETITELFHQDPDQLSRNEDNNIRDLQQKSP